jgi:FHS family glucose/mannose:H+ symporter-like MFS transporter
LYVGLENCVNGWFVTYLQEIDVMDASYASMLVSVTWFMMMIGRLVTARLSRRVSSRRIILMDCLATGGFFLLLVLTRSLPVITVALAGLGFFLAGIYPTSVSSGGEEILRSAGGMAVLQGIGALGGTITPEVVGVVSDHTQSVSSGIVLLGVNAAGMIALAAWGAWYGRKNERSIAHG